MVDVKYFIAWFFDRTNLLLSHAENATHLGRTQKSPWRDSPKRVGPQYRGDPILWIIIITTMKSSEEIRKTYYRSIHRLQSQLSEAGLKVGSTVLEGYRAGSQTWLIWRFSANHALDINTMSAHYAELKKVA